MPEYLYPGVYVEEVNTGNEPIQGVSTSTAGFLGIAERGPVTPVLCTSFGDYQRSFGSYVQDPDGTDHYLAYSVEGFFQNGGLRCFVQRVFHQDTVTPANSAQSAWESAGGMKITAIGPGAWGNTIAYQVSNAGMPDPTLFKLTILYWTGTPSPDMVSNPTASEVYDNLSAIPTASQFYGSAIDNVSYLVTVSQTGPGRPPNNAFAGSDPNVQVSSATITPTAAVTAAGTLIVSAGANKQTFTQNTDASKGPIIITVSDLLNAINTDTTVGAKASLTRAGNLSIIDPYGNGNLKITGTLTGNGMLGTFAASTTSALNGAGIPILLTGGNDGVNPNLQVGSVTGLQANGGLPNGDNLSISVGGAPTAFTINAAGPIVTVGNLITAINNTAALGVSASLNATGQFTIQDPQDRGTLHITGTLVESAAGAPGPLGLFSNTPAGYTEADFEGNDIDPSAKTGLLALGDVDEISLLACPDEFYFGTTSNAVAQMLQEQAEGQMDRFAILDAPVAAGQPQNNNPSVNSEYCAYYYPWLMVTNPNTDVNLLVPPCGHMAGIYARSDTNVGVQKDPANEVINGIVQLQLNINNQQQAILNPKGVNCLRYFTGAGNLVWGGRTTSTDPDWQYINVRRIFIFVEQSIKVGTQWVVFDINADPTWRRVVRSITDFLTTLWREGMLQGDTAAEAFFVKCDNTTMTQADIDAGRLICVIGIAPVKPAEFVIFQIGQWYGGSSVTEQ